MKTENIKTIYQKCREIAAEINSIKDDPVSLIAAQRLISPLEDMIQNKVLASSDLITEETVDEASEECWKIIQADFLKLLSKQLGL